jgi:hypothetical protein
MKTNIASLLSAGCLASGFLCLLAGCYSTRPESCAVSSPPIHFSGWHDTVVSEFRATPGEDIQTKISSTIDSVLPGHANDKVYWFVEGARTNVFEITQFGRPLAETIRVYCETNGLVFFGLNGTMVVADGMTKETEHVFICSGSLWTDKPSVSVQNASVFFSNDRGEWIKGTTAVAGRGEFISWATMKMVQPVWHYKDIRIERFAGWPTDNPVSAIKIVVEGLPPFTLSCEDAAASTTVFTLHLAHVQGSWRPLGVNLGD